MTERNFEQYILGIMNNVSGIESYAQELGFASEEDFVNQLLGKNVCDLGSGYDRFALEVILRKLPIKVTSVNPNRFDEHSRIWLPVIRQQVLQPRLSEFPIEELRAAFDRIDHEGIAAFAHDFSIFPDETFDEVLDVKAVWYYSLPKYREMYRKSAQEILRVTKVGGKIRIGDECNITEIENPWYLELFDDLGLDYNFIQRIGIEITRH